MVTGLSIQRLHARVEPGAQHVAARLALQCLAGELEDALPTGLAPQAVLLLRSLHLRVPVHALSRPPDAALRSAVREAGRVHLADCAAHAQRPALGAGADDAAAVLFADSAEMLACLARDALANRLDRWWWRSLLGPGFPDWRRAFAVRPEAQPAALRLLARHDAAAARAVALDLGLPLPAAARAPAGAPSRGRGAGADAQPAGAPLQQVPNDETILTPVMPMAAQQVAAAADGASVPLRRPTPGADDAGVQAAALARVAGGRAAIAPLGLGHVAGPPAGERSVDPQPSPPVGGNAAPLPPEVTTSPAAQPTATPRPAQGHQAAAQGAGAPAQGRPLDAGAGSAEPPRQHIAEPSQAPVQSAVSPAAAPAGVQTVRPVAHRAAAPLPEGKVDGPLAAVGKRRRDNGPAVAPSAIETPAATPAEQTWPLPAPIFSRHGRMLLLVNCLLEDGLYPDFTRPRDPGFPLPMWALLALLGDRFLGASWRDDPLCVALRRHGGEVPARRRGALARDWPQGAGPPPRPLHLRHCGTHSLERWMWNYSRGLRLRLARRLDLPARGAAVARALHGQSACIWWSEGEIVARFKLDLHPVAWRLAGLDRDPGYLPSAGVSLRFVFE